MLDIPRERELDLGDITTAEQTEGVERIDGERALLLDPLVGVLARPLLAEQSIDAAFDLGAVGREAELEQVEKPLSRLLRSVPEAAVIALFAEDLGDLPLDDVSIALLRLVEDEAANERALERAVILDELHRIMAEAVAELLLG